MSGENMRPSDYLFLYAGYGYAVSSIVLNIMGRNVLKPHWIQLVESFNKGNAFSELCGRIMIDGVAIGLLYTFSIFFLVLLVISAKKRISRSNINIAKWYGIVSIGFLVLMAVGVVFQCIMLILRVHSLGIGTAKEIAPHYPDWHRMWEMSSFGVIILFSSLLIEDAPLNHKNNAFQALVMAVFGVMLVFARHEWIYYYGTMIALCASGCFLQRHVSAAKTSDDEAHKGEPEEKDV